MALVCEPLLAEGDSLLGDGEVLLHCEEGAAAIVFFGSLPTTIRPGESLAVTVQVADGIGAPVSGEEVTLSLSGVEAETPAPAMTATDGSASFTLTPGIGALRLVASAAGIDSLPSIVHIAVDPMDEVVEYARTTKRAKGRIMPDKPSWQDIGPIAATPRPAPAPSVGSMPQQQTMRPGMAQLGQAIAQLAADQEAKLAAEVQAAQQELEG